LLSSLLHGCNEWYLGKKNTWSVYCVECLELICISGVTRMLYLLSLIISMYIIILESTPNDCSQDQHRWLYNNLYTSMSALWFVGKL